MKRVPIIFGGENPEITAMWKSLTMGKIDQLKKLSNVEPKGMIQVSTNFSEGRMEEKGELDQYIGVATTKESPENFSSIQSFSNIFIFRLYFRLHGFIFWFN